MLLTIRFLQMEKNHLCEHVDHGRNDMLMIIKVSEFFSVFDQWNQPQSTD